MTPSRTPSQLELLSASHSEWVRGLARRLVGDPQAADDVAQETWVVALQRRGDVVPAWLAGVARNVAHRARRSVGRRLEHERRGREPAASLSPDQILVREDARRRVVEALLTLREPYRTTLLERYYEDLGPSEIAARRGVPAETVRTQLRRGLAHLRAALGEDDADDTSWIGGIALLAGDAPPRSALTVGLGLLVMTKVVAAVLFLGVSWLGWRLWRADVDLGVARDVPVQTAGGPSEAPPSLPRTEPREPARVAPEPDAPAEPPAGDPLAWVLAAERPAGRLAGNVAYLRDARPAAGARVEAWPSTGPLPAGQRLDDGRAPRSVATVADANGDFRFEGLARGPYLVRASATDGATGTQVGVATEDGAFVSIDVELENGLRVMKELRLRVVDGDGAPVAGAAVELRGGGATTAQWPERGRWSGHTDARGELHFPRLELLRGIVLAREGARVARCDLARASGLLQREATPDGAPCMVLPLVLRAPGRLTGSVVGAPAGAVVVAWARVWDRTPRIATAIPFRADLDATGRFVFDQLAPGDYLLSVENVGDLRLRTDDPDARITVTAGETVSAQLALCPGPVLEGTVVSALDGTPMVDAVVFVRAADAELDSLTEPAASAEDGHPLLDRVARTDGQGHYRVTGLQPGAEVRVEVHRAGWSFDRTGDVRLVDEESTVLHHMLEPAGGLQGLATPRTLLGLRRVGEQEFHTTLETAAEGVAPFTVLGLAPGTWEIFAVTRRANGRRTRLGQVEVRAGELAWIDLRFAAPDPVRGRVLWRGKPVAGARISFEGPWMETGEDGAFAFHHAFASEGWQRFTLRCPRLPDAVPLKGWAGNLRSRRFQDLAVELPEGVLELEVLDEHGVAVPATVELAWSGPDVPDPQDGLVLFQPGVGHDPIVRATDARGRVRFELLPAGRYLARAVREGEVWPALELDLSDGQLVQRSLPRAAGGALVVRARGADGGPAPGTGIELRGTSPSGDPVTLSVTPADAEGVLRFGSLPPGEYLVGEVRGPLERMDEGTTVRVEAGATSEVDVRVAR